MQNNKSLKLAFATLTLALVSALAFNPGSFAAPQASPAQTGELPATKAAKSIVARIGTPDFSKITDSRKREVAQQAYNALKAVANNTSRERQPALFAEVVRTYQAMLSYPKPKPTRAANCDMQHQGCLDAHVISKEECDAMHKMCQEGENIMTWLWFHANCMPPGPTLAGCAEY